MMDLMTTDEKAPELNISVALNGVLVIVSGAPGSVSHTFVFNDPDDFSKFVVGHFWGEEPEKADQWTEEELIKIRSLDLPPLEINNILARKSTSAE